MSPEYLDSNTAQMVEFIIEGLCVTGVFFCFVAGAATITWYLPKLWRKK